MAPAPPLEFLDEQDVARGPLFDLQRAAAMGGCQSELASVADDRTGPGGARRAKPPLLENRDLRDIRKPHVHRAGWPAAHQPIRFDLVVVTRLESARPAGIFHAMGPGWPAASVVDTI